MSEDVPKYSEDGRGSRFRVMGVPVLLGTGIVLLVGLGAISVVAGIDWVSRIVTRRVQDARSGPLHTFPLGATPAFLTDEVALAKARDALGLDGYDTSAWQPVEDDRSRAPDGTPDRYLLRNTIDANDGTILFRDTSGRDRNPARIVHVVVKGDHVECQVVEPK